MKSDKPGERSFQDKQFAREEKLKADKAKRAGPGGIQQSGRDKRKQGRQDRKDGKGW